MHSGTVPHRIPEGHRNLMTSMLSLVANTAGVDQPSISAPHTEIVNSIKVNQQFRYYTILYYIRCVWFKIGILIDIIFVSINNSYNYICIYVCMKENTLLRWPLGLSKLFIGEPVYLCGI